MVMNGYWTRPELLTVNSRVAKSAISLRLKTLWGLYVYETLLEGLAQAPQAWRRNLCVGSQARIVTDAPQAGR